MPGLGTRFSRLGESLTKLGKIIGNLNNFWGKSLMKLGEFTINLAKIRNTLGRVPSPILRFWFKKCSFDFF